MRRFNPFIGFLAFLFILVPAAFASINDFQTVLTLSTGVSPRGLAAGDLYGNGSKSVVVANFGSSTFIGQTTPVSILNLKTSELQVFTSSPAGLKLDATIPTAASPRGVFLFDLGQSGRQDILTTAYDANLLQVFSWVHGQFVKTGEEPTQTMPVGVTAGWTSKQGSPFVAVANYGSHTLSLFQTIHGKLGKRIDLPTATGPTQVAIGDLDSDGLNEIAVVCLSAHQIEIFKMSAGKTNDLSSYALSQTLQLPLDGSPADLRIADLNGDGKMDLVAADFTKNEIDIYDQQKDGTLAAQPPMPTSGSHPNGLTVADLDGDGSNEIIVANRDSDSIDLFQRVNGQFQLAETLKTSDETGGNFGPVEVAAIDTNGSGKLGLVATHMRSNSLKVFTQAPPVTSSAAKALTGDSGQVNEPFSEQTTVCYPNPTNDGRVKFSFTLEEPSAVNLRIFDIQGEMVWAQNLSPSQTQGGKNVLNWNGINQAGGKLASGLYLCVITVGTNSVTRKVAIVH